MYGAQRCIFWTIGQDLICFWIADKSSTVTIAIIMEKLQWLHNFLFSRTYNFHLVWMKPCVSNWFVIRHARAFKKW